MYMQGQVENSSSPRNRVVVILGSGRSGSSLLTHVLHELGMSVSQKLTAANPTNPKGAWEDEEILETSRSILKLYGRRGRRTAFFPLPPGWTQDERVQAIKNQLSLIVARNISSGSGIWGFKEPVTSVLLPLWKEIFRDLDISPMYILALRNPLAVRRSFATAYEALTEQQGELIWLYRNAQAVLHMDDDYLVVNYEDWFKDPVQQANNLGEFAGINHEQAGEQFLQDKLEKIISTDLNTCGDDRQSELLFPCVQDLYDLLKNDTGDSATREKLRVTAERAIEILAYFSPSIDHMVDSNRARIKNNAMLENRVSGLMEEQHEAEVENARIAGELQSVRRKYRRKKKQYRALTKSPVYQVHRVIRRLLTPLLGPMRSVKRFHNRAKNGAKDVYHETAFLVATRLLSPVAFFLKQDVWLVAERLGKSAEESGYTFFKYCVERYPEKKIFYVANKGVKPADNFPDENRIIRRVSLKNLFMVLKAECLFFTNDPKDAAVIRNKWLLKRTKTIFLRHGIGTYSNGKYLQKQAGTLNVVCCTSELEKEILTRNCALADNSMLKVTGQPRFDTLYRSSNEKRYILVTPTWRYKLSKYSADQLMESTFIKAFFSFFEDNRVQTLLDKAGMQIHFRMHFRMMQVLKSLKLPANVVMEDEDKVNMQQSLINAALLITDYSSIMWDMAYMHKPVILYQFDQQQFLNERGREHFNIDDADMFCPIVFTADDLITTLTDFVEREFELSATEKERADSFFAYRDSANCARILEAANALL